MSHDDLTTAAHDYNRRGWRVIPLHYISKITGACSCKEGARCGSKGKHPKDMAWQRNERLSGADIQSTWGDAQFAPNIGIATGTESGFWVLDIDPKGGGMESMAALVATHGRLPDTYVVQTGSGGFHYYFRLPGFELRNSSGRVGPGIDTRANGGQVVAAGSLTDKGPYLVVQDAPLADAPEWLLEIARKAEVDTSIVTAADLPKPEDLDEAAWKRLSAYAQRAIDSEIQRLTALKAAGWNMPWNHTTFEVSCSLLEFANSPWCAYSPGQARADVLAHTPRDNDGFDSHTVIKTFESAVERVGTKARPMPEDRRKTDEVDPLFAGADVRNPSATGGAEATPAGVGISGPGRFFGGEKGTTLLAAELATGVMEMGPIGWGLDEDFWSYRGGVWRSDPHVVTDRIVSLLGNNFRKSHVSNTEDIVRVRAHQITGDPLPDFMNFRNGMLDWRTGDLVDHDPSYCSTVQFGTDWDASATCSTFENFLADVMHDDYVALTWEMLGYLMFSGNPMQMAFMLYGTGQNGKGTLIRVMEDLLGRENIATESLDDLNQNRFSAINLYGKIANLAGDIDGTYQESTANFKKLTGEDTYAGERKFGHRFNFESWACPVFSANKFPGSADVTEGYLRRWTVLHFHKHIDTRRRIIGFSDILARELPGIAAKAVSHLRVLMERGRFDPSGEAVKAKDMFAMAIDQCRQWLVDGDVTGGPEVETSLRALYASYVLWADRSNQRKLREAEFSHRLEAIGYEVVDIAGAVYHRGISVPVVPAQTPSNFFS